MGNPHALVVPYPAEGHIIPLMELSQRLVNTVHIHEKFKNAITNLENIGSLFHLALIEDGRVVFRVLHGKVEEHIEQINQSKENEITCVLADQSLGWAMEIAERMRNKKLPSVLLQLHFWFTDLKNIFELMVRKNRSVKLADQLIYNSNYDLEPGAFKLDPQILLCFRPEDSACLKWLDQQPPQSVIYVAFVCFTIFNPTQFQELALGLELSNRPFLWVVQANVTDKNYGAFPEGFLERGTTSESSCHPSIACFLSHCSRNSPIEGVHNGIPILCWPYFADQFINQNYICDVWKIGLGFDRNESKIITRVECKKKSGATAE
ncbi:hypothetical protein UlMin_014624 [Ulmus minor]